MLQTPLVDHEEELLLLKIASLRRNRVRNSHDQTLRMDA